MFDSALAMCVLVVNGSCEAHVDRLREAGDTFPMGTLGMGSWHRGWMVIAIGAVLCSCHAGKGSTPSGGSGADGGSATHGGSAARSGSSAHSGSGGAGGTRADAGMNTGSDPGADEKAALEQLAACRPKGGDADITAAVVITDEYADSLHELIGCGGLSFALCSAVIDGIVDAIVAQSNDATPDGWEFVGDGVYRTGSDSTTMDATFYLAEDFSFAKAGDPVMYDLFLVDSYLVNAKLRVDLTTGKARINYDKPGPLVELLGFGAKPANPLPVNLSDLTSIKKKLRQLEFEGKVVVQDEREHSTIDYTLNVPRMSAVAFVTGATTMGYELENVDGTRADLHQKIVTSMFDVAYAMHGTLTGKVEFHVDGGPLEYDATLVWDDTPYPERTLMCP
jgi:hypothetical protein